MKSEVLKLNQREFSINVTGHKIDSIREKGITKKGARVFDDGKVFSSSFVGEIEDQQLIDQAKGNVDGAIAYDWDLPQYKSIDGGLKTSYFDQNDFIQHVQQTLDFFENEFPNFIFSGGAQLHQSKKELVADSEKMQVQVDDCQWGFMYKHKQSKSVADGFVAGHTFAKFDMLSIAKKYAAYLQAFEVEAAVKPGKMPVVFLDSSQLYRKVLESAKIDTYTKGVGLYSGKLGQKLFSERFSLYDVSYDVEDKAFSLFDGDAVVRKDPKLAIIENGEFTNLVSDLRNAAKYSAKSTGNGKRSYDSTVALGFNNIRLGKGQRSVEDILAAMPNCLVVEMAAGGEFTDTGDFSTPVQGSFLLSSGKVVGKAPQLTLKSSVDSMFGDDFIEAAKNSISQFSASPALFCEMEVILN